VSTIEEQIRAVADEAFAQTEPILRTPQTGERAGSIDDDLVTHRARRGGSKRSGWLAAAAIGLGVALVGGLLALADRSNDNTRTDEPTLSIGAPMVRRFDGPALTDVAVSPDADRLAVAGTDEICVVSTSASGSFDADRCFPVAMSIASGSTTWSPDAGSLVFHHDLYRLDQEPDLVRLDLANGELTALTDDGIDGAPTDGDGSNIDVAPIFGPDGTLYFFRVDTSNGVQAALLEYDGDGVVTATGSTVAGIPGTLGRRLDGTSIVTTVVGSDGATELVSIDTDGGPNRSIPDDGSAWAVAGAVRERALLVVPDSSGSLQLSIADFATREISPIDLPPLETTRRVSGAGLSPDGRRIAIITADQNDAAAHQLLVADIADDASVAPFTVLATGPQFAPNDGEPTIRPAGIGRFAEIVWTDTALVFALGADEIVTLPLV
jgi:hypothetical protein